MAKKNNLGSGLSASKITDENGRKLIATDELSGCTFCVKADTEYFVSKAVFKLLQDPQVKETVAEQLPIINLIDYLTEHSRKHKNLTLTASGLTVQSK